MEKNNLANPSNLIQSTSNTTKFKKAKNPKKSRKSRKAPKRSQDALGNDKNHIERTTMDDIVVLDDVSDTEGYDDYDGHYDNPQSSEISNVAPQLKVNLLASNEDFIALSNSSSDEEATDKVKAQPTKKPISDGVSSSVDTTHTAKLLTTDYPWIINHDHSKQKEIADWLTMEIRDFVSYISPSKEEIKERNDTIGRIRDAVNHFWNDANLHVFGSYATDLYLPGSDIDCVIISEKGDKDSRSSLYALANFLKKRGLATDIEVIAKARVPIIKFIDPRSKIHIDVSFERINGLEAAKLIREWLNDTPGLREITLIVKQFLHARRLNNVHTGGLGGFSIICLVFSFLQMHPRIISNEIDPMENLGVLLVEFFELYGKNFGYDDIAITTANGYPIYLPKSDWKGLQQLRSSFSLAIQDPGDATNNISRGSFNLRDIKKAFAGAFDLLTNRCFELDTASFKERIGKSVLGNVIKYRGKQRDFKDERSLVINKAIIENENYHKKRSTIVREEFIESTDDTNDEKDDIYIVEEPPLKKQKPMLKKKESRGVVKINAQRDNIIAATPLTTPIAIPGEQENNDDYNPLDC
ncbi:non-canonical poly(A) polymerase PAP2 NDAI_0G04030 [Naumovozyma dairenensis CBS 421]|uniref:polynucleotide adenylyltransferase n=1 Tax=Naumovozyma dairenensis (strain ATCC 10597 / BCRC 20456 / CBS 421 / NBRC 0211 / NRRL Y-12639) TaxID=1071378 RepID=G0WEG9_NAUDC|nr:hypothetical protein NDAI_0G04030 [Naumovozyma dairenensis CBS 421]CCD26180.2 hypothetical protein NDAI_0G04030 [Naumovozyma dairenensis CBS 421]